MQEQIEEMKENKQSKKNERDNIVGQIAKMENNRKGLLGKAFQVRKGTRRYFKVVAFTVKAMIGLMLEVRRERNMPPGIKKREAVVRELDSALIKATIQTKEWLLQTIRTPILTIL